MLHIVKFCGAKLWAAALLAIVLSALLLAAARLLLPMTADYREQLAALLAERIGMPVRIERLGARMSGLAPELGLDGFELLDPKDGSVRLRFEEVRLRAALFASLLSGELRPAQVTVVGARLVLRRRADGRLVIADGAADGSGNRTVMPSALMLPGGRLHLERGEILWDSREPGQPPLRLTGVDARLVNVGERHQLDLRAGVPDATGRLRIRADLFGDPAAPRNWRGAIHLEGKGLDLARVAAMVPGEPPGVAGKLDLEVWSQWMRGRPLAAAGRWDLRDPELAGVEQGVPWPRIAGRFAARQQGDGWRIRVRDLLLSAAAGETVGDLDLRVAREDDGGLRLAAGLEHLALEELVRFAEAAPAAAPWRAEIAALSPRGTLEGLQLKLTAAPAGIREWQARGRLRALSTRPVGDIPGVDGLDLAFRADADHGELELAGDRVEIRFTDLFRWPWAGNRVAGSVRWRRSNGGELELSSDDLRLENRDLTTRSRLLVRIDPAGTAPFLDLQTDFRDGDGTVTSKYLPVAIMPDELVDWLDSAIVSGRVSSGSFLFRGEADAFPFYRRDGRFQVLFGIEHAVLDYQRDWPRLEEIAAELEFDNESLSIEVVEAKLLDSDVVRARMNLPDLDNARLVYIDGRVRGPFADGFRILRETPLSRRQARYVQGMRADGTSVLDLQLAIPVKRGYGYALDGRLSWAPDAALTLEDWNLELTRLEGTLGFTIDGVFAQGLAARLWDDPVRLDVDTLDAGDGAPSRTRIDVWLDLDPRRLARQYSHWLWDSLAGRTPGRLSLEIDHEAAAEAALPVRYRLDSTLLGLGVDLPEPLGKEPSAERAFHLTGVLPPREDTLLELGYGDILAGFRLGTAADGGLGMVAGEVQCGTGRSPVALDKGFRLGGRLERLDLEGWMGWLESRPTLAPSATDGPVTPSQRVDLTIDRLQLPDWELSDVKLSMVRTPNAWEAEVTSREANGNMRIPDDPRSSPVSAHFSSLRLDMDAPTEVAAPRAGSVDAPDPARAPGLFVTVDQLYLGDRPVGAAELVAAPVPAGLKLESVKLDGPLLSLSGSGSWLAEPGGEHTRLKLEARSADLGQALRDLGFSSAIGDAEVELKADLHWAAAPTEVDLERLAGDLRFRVGKGRVLELDPGVGRLFGLFNIGALSRRLSLDFSDLFAQGYAFDRIDGRFTLAEGNAHSEEFIITGPSVDMEISGRTGLTSRDYDQWVMVTPEVSAALPVAGAIAGGPVVGAALLLAERIMGNEMNKLARVRYRVTGPWDEPEITRVQTRDANAPGGLQATGEKETAGGFVH